MRRRTCGSWSSPEVGVAGGYVYFAPDDQAESSCNVALSCRDVGRVSAAGGTEDRRRAAALAGLGAAARLRRESGGRGATRRRPRRASARRRAARSAVDAVRLGLVSEEL